MKRLQLVWKHKWASLIFVAMVADWFVIGTFNIWLFFLAISASLLGFAFPIQVARVEIKEQEEAELEAEEAEAKSLEEVILELREAGLVQIHPSEEKTE